MLSFALCGGISLVDKTYTRPSLSPIGKAATSHPSQSHSYTRPQAISRLLFFSLLGSLSGLVGNGGVGQVHASPFDPRLPPPLWFGSGTYFNGWFLRSVDVENRSSFCVIFGSLRLKSGDGIATESSAGYTSHYLGLSYLDAEGKTHTINYFPDPEAVSITSDNGEQPKRWPDRFTDADFRWAVAGVGEVVVNSSGGHLRFKIPGLEVAATFGARRPWNKKKPNDSCPEGWLTHTGLLPLHYFVHSFGSDTEYELIPDGAPPVQGHSLTHFEANYGDVFPTGWVWAQGCSITPMQTQNTQSNTETDTTNSNTNTKTHVENSARYGVEPDIDVEKNEKFHSDRKVHSEGHIDSYIHEKTCTAIRYAALSGKRTHFVLTGGRFVIGPLTTNQWVLAYRSDDIEWDFRTTDLDKVEKHVLSYAEGRLKVTAKSRCGKRIMEIDIHAPPDSFGEAIFVPTHAGWSNSPGCVESYAATATLKCYKKENKRADMQLIEEVVMPLSALEFGGLFQGT